VRLITEARLQRRTLETHGADIPIGKAFDPCVFFAEADTTGEQDNRRVEAHTAEFGCQHGFLRFVHGLSLQLIFNISFVIPANAGIQESSKFTGFRHSPE
jgi:hypothetical protein